MKYKQCKQMAAAKQNHFVGEGMRRSVKKYNSFSENPGWGDKLVWSSRNLVTAEEVSAISYKFAWFECSEGHQWFNRVIFISQRYGSNSCPVCTGRQTQDSIHNSLAICLMCEKTYYCRCLNNAKKSMSTCGIDLNIPYSALSPTAAVWHLCSEECEEEWVDGEGNDVRRFNNMNVFREDFNLGPDYFDDPDNWDGDEMIGGRH
jgi:hypothetical protein